MDIVAKQIAVKVDNLTVAYNGSPVLSNCSFAIESGKKVAIIGQNGAGKTTLLKAMLGLVKPICGNIDFFSSGKLTKAMRKKIAYVPQSESVDWDFPLSVLDVVLMGRYCHIGWCKRVTKRHIDIALFALEAVSMQSEAYCQIGELSGGQRQRVFLARAIAQEADLYFMDEPFKGVDITTEKAIVELFDNLKNAGKTIVVVHHDLPSVREYFDDAIVVNKKVLGYGTVDEVFKSGVVLSAYNKSEIGV